MSRRTKVNRRELKFVVAARVLEVGFNARAEVVDSNHLVAVGEKTVHQSRPDEPGCAGHLVIA